jgi:hypothetical protein
MHIARVKMKNIPDNKKKYSQKWLMERQGLVAKAVGVGVMALSPENKTRASNVQAAMVDAVECSIKAGIDIDYEASEVSRRMQMARAKERGGESRIGWKK